LCLGKNFYYPGTNADQMHFLAQYTKKTLKNNNKLVTSIGNNLNVLTYCQAHYHLASSQEQWQIKFTEETTGD